MEASALGHGDVLDVAIVGGGVSGLYSGFRLLESGAAASGKVEVFESSERVGGRLLSVTPPGLPKARIELGGMRFTTGQKKVAALVEHLGLKTVEFPVGVPDNVAYVRGRRLLTKDLNDPSKIPYVLTEEEKERLKKGLDFTTLAAERFLKEVEPPLPQPIELQNVPWRKLAYEGRYHGTLLRNLPLRYLYARQVSYEALEYSGDTSGYDSIYETWNAVDGFPWNIGDYGASIQYKRLVDGYESLPRTIEERFKKAGGVTRLRHRLLSFDTTRLPDGDGVALKLTTDRGHRTVLAKKLILAMPRRSLELLDQSGVVLAPEQRDVHTLIRSVVPIPLFKLALCYRKRWWEPERSKGQSITDMPIRQCYYWPTGSDEGPGAILVYDDGLDLDYWACLRGHPEKFENEPHAGVGGEPDPEWYRHRAPKLMVHEAHRQLCIMHGISNAPLPYAAAYRDWGEDPFGGGANFWPVGVLSYDVAERILQPVKGVPVYVCGEAYSHAQGWVEGALQTAEDMLRKLGVKPPPYLV